MCLRVFDLSRLHQTTSAGSVAHASSIYHWDQKVERQWDHFNGVTSANADKLLVWTLQGTIMLRCN
jgi:hypothetical protein